MLVAEKLYKSFGSFEAVKNVSFELKQGEIFGFLGPNGAGKTTTINILTTLSRPTSGTVQFNDQNIFQNEEYKRRIGIVDAEPFLYNMMTAREFLNFTADLREIPKNERTCIDEYLELFDMHDSADKLTGQFSTGMKKKIAVISAIIHKPEILFLDEPTISLDAVSVHTFKKILQNLKNSGTAVFLTTHILEIAEKLCDHIAIIKNGSIVRSGQVSEILDMSGHKDLEELFIDIAKSSS